MNFIKPIDPQTSYLTKEHRHIHNLEEDAYVEKPLVYLYNQVMDYPGEVRVKDGEREQLITILCGQNTDNIEQ